MAAPLATPLPLALHNPALLPADVLLAEYTARRPLLDYLLDIVRKNAPGQPPQHALLIGARGMGKTTTLWAVAHMVAKDADLQRQWLPVVFDEESRRVGDLADFWLEAIRQWEHAANDPVGRATQLLNNPGAGLEERARSTFLDLVTRSGRRALLLIDNLNDLLSSIHDPEPLHRLRAFLMDDSRVMIIGTATRLFAEISDLDRPFYEFFREFQLRALTSEEMEECLLGLAIRRGDEKVRETLKQQTGTLKAFHLLTGGNPRLIKTFYRLLASGLRGDIRTDLERLLDEFTPYFKAIVDALPAQQQRIIDAVALAWDPVEVAAVARATRVPSNQVSAQLRALVRIGLVMEAAGQPKRKTYLLADRFSNIHYLMRHGRAASNRFDWFVAMVRLIFPDKEHTDVLARLACQSANCGPEGARDARDLLYSAMSHADSEDSRRQILHAAFRESWGTETLASLSNWLDMAEARRHLPEIGIVEFFARMPLDLRQGIGYEPANVNWWCCVADILRQQNAWELAEAACRKAIELDPKYAPAWNYLGDVLANCNRHAAAESAYRRALELNPKSVAVWNNMGIVLTNLGRLAEAVSAYQSAIELNPTYAAPWNNLGDVRASLGQLADAERDIRRAIEVNTEDAPPWSNLGILMARLGRLIESETAFQKAIKLNPKFVDAWYGLGVTLVKLGRLAEAEKPLRRAIELSPTSGDSWQCLGIALAGLGSYGEAENAYRRAIELDPNAAASWNGLGRVLANLGRHSEAENAVRRSIELTPQNAILWNNLGIVLASLGRHVEAENVYRKAIELDDHFARPWENLGNVLTHLDRHTEAENCYRKAIELDPKDPRLWNNLAAVLSNLSRDSEAEIAYRKAIELDTKYVFASNGLGILLLKLGRPAEAETVFREALQNNPSNSFAWSCLADVVAMEPGRNAEARECLIRALSLEPDHFFAHSVFLRRCASHSGDWRTVLPGLAAWCVVHPKDAATFNFTVDGFIRLARLTTPAEALAMLNALPDSAPFETLIDAFRAHADREHLNRLAPERRALAIELLNRITAPEPAKPAAANPAKDPVVEK